MYTSPIGVLTSRTNGFILKSIPSQERTQFYSGHIMHVMKYLGCILFYYDAIIQSLDTYVQFPDFLNCLINLFIQSTSLEDTV